MENKNYCMPDGIKTKEDHEEYLIAIGYKDSIDMKAKKEIKYPYKLIDKVYCCPFCSHGEDINVIKIEIQKPNNQWRVIYSLKCPTCFSYPIYDETTKYHKITDNEVLDKAMGIFIKLTDYTKDIKDFILV